jgi:hypothetical protein
MSIKESLDHIDCLALILYPKAENYIYPESQCVPFSESLPFEREERSESFGLAPKKFSKNKLAQIFTSFPLSEFNNLRVSFFLFHCLEAAFKRGSRSIVCKKNNRYFTVNKNKLNKQMVASKQNLRSVDNVPFFMPRTGINRTLQGMDLGSKLFKLSKKILSKRISCKN